MLPAASGVQVGPGESDPSLATVTTRRRLQAAATPGSLWHGFLLSFPNSVATASALTSLQNPATVVRFCEFAGVSCTRVVFSNIGAAFGTAAGFASLPAYQLASFPSVAAQPALQPQPLLPDRLSYGVTAGI